MSELPVEGDRIECVHMPHDPAPIKKGTAGTVWSVNNLDFAGCVQIGVKWDDGRTLSLCCPPDRYRIIERVMD